MPSNALQALQAAIAGTTNCWTNEKTSEVVRLAEMNGWVQYLSDPLVKTIGEADKAAVDAELRARFPGAQAASAQAAKPAPPGPRPKHSPNDNAAWNKIASHWNAMKACWDPAGTPQGARMAHMLKWGVTDGAGAPMTSEVVYARFHDEMNPRSMDGAPSPGRGAAKVGWGDKDLGMNDWTNKRFPGLLQAPPRLDDDANHVRVSEDAVLAYSAAADGDFAADAAADWAEEGAGEGPAADCGEGEGAAHADAAAFEVAGRGAGALL